MKSEMHRLLFKGRHPHLYNKNIVPPSDETNKIYFFYSPEQPYYDGFQ